MKSLLNRRTECNICYKNVVRLTQHVRQSHDMDMSTYMKSFTLNPDEDNDTADETDSNNSSKSDDMTESGSENESNMGEDMPENEEWPTFFEHLLKNINSWEDLSDKELTRVLAATTHWFMDLKCLSKNDAMYKKIVRKTKKYEKNGLKTHEAMMAVFEKEMPYFDKLTKRTLEDKE